MIVDSFRPLGIQMSGATLIELVAVLAHKDKVINEQCQSRQSSQFPYPTCNTNLQASIKKRRKIDKLILILLLES